MTPTSAAAAAIKPKEIKEIDGEAKPALPALPASLSAPMKKKKKVPIPISSKTVSDVASSALPAPSPIKASTLAVTLTTPEEETTPYDICDGTSDAIKGFISAEAA
jgi:hypothetical protein